MISTTDWKASDQPRRFVDTRIRIASYKNPDSSIVNQRVQAFRGLVWRKVDGKVEQQTCDHAHIKRSVANTCATKMANRLNREVAR